MNTRKQTRQMALNTSASAKMRRKLNRIFDLSNAGIRLEMKRIYDKKLAGSPESEKIHPFKGFVTKETGDGYVVDPKPQGIKTGYYPHIKAPEHGIYAWTPVFLRDKQRSIDINNKNWLPNYLIAYPKKRGGQLVKHKLDIDQYVFNWENKRRSKNAR